MKLWSYQPKEVVSLLSEGSAYSCDPTKSEILTSDVSKLFIPAYEYMSTKLSELTPAPENVVYPVWSWLIVDEEEIENILSDETYQCEYVLELDVPDDEVLLSDFEQFHQVLNDSPCFSHKEVRDYCVERNCNDYDIAKSGGMWCDTHGYEFFDSLDEYTREEKIASWDKYVFCKDESQGRVQACFWQIKPEYVVNVHKVK